VTWGSGWDPQSSGIRARRINDTVEILLNYARVAANKFAIPIHGDVGNVTICSGLPSQFRPASGDFGAFAVGPSGRQWAGYVLSDGNVVLSNAMPWVNQTGNKQNDQRAFSGKALFHAGTF
jgi:hypothetical protein